MLQQIFSLSFMTAFLAAAVRLAVPLMYGGIGETIAEKSGILNIGMEGVMLSGAFFSFAGAWYSGNLFVGLLCGMAGGLIVSLLHGLLSITLIQTSLFLVLPSTCLCLRHQLLLINVKWTGVSADRDLPKHCHSRIVKDSADRRCIF